MKVVRTAIHLISVLLSLTIMKSSLEVVGTTMGYQISAPYSDFPRLQDDQRAVVEGPITLDEIKSAISEIQGQKSPGPERITSEFYKLFVPSLAPVLLDVFQTPYDAGFLPPTFYSGHTIFIPKTQILISLKQSKDIAQFGSVMWITNFLLRSYIVVLSYLWLA